jgi:hypothetical protein
MSKPLRVISAFIRNASGYDTTLQVLSRQEYNDQGLKTQSGSPNQCYYDIQEPNANFKVLNAPTDALSTIHAQVQRQFYDMTSSSDNFDFPQEWFQALKWNLANELAVEYGVDANLIPYFEGKAKQFLDECFDWSVEESSIYFTVDQRANS